MSAFNPYFGISCFQLSDLFGKESNMTVASQKPLCPGYVVSEVSTHIHDFEVAAKCAKGFVGTVAWYFDSASVAKFKQTWESGMVMAAKLCTIGI